MKRKFFLSAVTMLLLLFLGYGCSDNDYLTDREIQNMIDNSLEGQWKIVNFEIKKTDWKWNSEAAQWQAFRDLPQLNSNIYEEGAILGYVFLGEQGVDEVQKLLPYVETYRSGNEVFTETISADYQLGNPSTVGFFIKDSRLFQDPNAPNTLNFRIVLIY